jgi:hypothetical protein
MKIFGCMLSMLTSRVVQDKSTRIHFRGLSQNIAESEFSKIGKKPVYTCDNIEIN